MLNTLKENKESVAIIKNIEKQHVADFIALSAIYRNVYSITIGIECTIGFSITSLLSHFNLLSNDKTKYI